MKFDLRDLKKALAKIEKCGTIGEVELEFDPHQRLLIKYSEPSGEQRCVITIFQANTQKMAEITTTTRL